MKLTLAEIAAAMGAVGDLGSLENVAPSGVQTDSRILKHGEIFFCVSGENFDGHNFACEAVEKGAMAVVGSQPPGLGCPEDLGVPYLMVPDTVTALGRLARRVRDDASAKVVVVTGSAGKTTVKEMLAQILSRVGTTCKNHLNLNNRLGLPRSIFEADPDAAFWVLEAGINMEGEMDDLGAAAGPDLAVIVNVGPAHLEGLGDVDGVARNKSRILAHLAEDGRGLINLDYPELVSAAFSLEPRCIGFSAKALEHDEASKLKGLARYHGEFLGMDEEGKSRFEITLDGATINLALDVPGALMAENITAAAAAAHLLGVEPEVIAAGLAAIEYPQQRFARRQAGPWLVIDDSYNANPLSMGRALSSAREAAAGGNLVVALGEMRELGSSAGSAHETLGRQIAAAQPAAVFWKGGEYEAIRRGLQESGYQGKHTLVSGADDFMNAWKSLGMDALDGGVILFKASRTIRMEQLAQAFIKERAA
ncbi:UDP-N-acetylmuramoyl-tripeptide--D-alanyl-D-alanine ligase [Oceanidesulfovibrio marinus]|uniref:UDP-N-acetylmuramoyl-tripeptide--D-alanyl-D-alanine ligase n=1 Tax=Oceanidesulfovibrio marinus TaxID=370038 RepID=A0ABX6NGI0_9BACT|nr:UDP-N-acetylmuramoyl-tripeptide--D-alanyl-D-alanine ligase [Oceanidesulfovibrio marinus]QJT08862.1 UDP-N-acetylmuramoyl-tripeptide--D-alanyl-D-alanine ligase [Oceanidesulfovibrio marinus]